jgi:hypothetical protein
MFIFLLFIFSLFNFMGMFVYFIIAFKNAYEEYKRTKFENRVEPTLR